jgi:hypothetical protein
MLTQTQPKPAELSPETKALLTGAFPLLQNLHAKQDIANGQFPAHIPDIGSKTVKILPYYMNRGDPPELGVWKIEVADQEPVRITSVPSYSEGIHFALTVGKEGRPLPPEQSHSLALGMKFLHDRWEESERSKNSPPTKGQRKPKSLGRVLLPKLLARVKPAI